jgi:hypothetical protein
VIDSRIRDFLATFPDIIRSTPAAAFENFRSGAATDVAKTDKVNDVRFIDDQLVHLKLLCCRALWNVQAGGGTSFLPIADRGIVLMTWQHLYGRYPMRKCLHFLSCLLSTRRLCPPGLCLPLLVQVQKALAAFEETSCV